MLLPVQISNIKFQIPNFKNWKLEIGNWKFSKAFSLIELLVVITIIGLLITAGTVYYTKSQQKVRDAKRKSDLKTIQVALDSYYQKNGSYPKLWLPTPGFKIQCYTIVDPTQIPPTRDTSIKEWATSFTCNSDAGQITYLKELPKDLNQDASENNRYLYYSVTATCSLELFSNTPQRYVLYAKLENTNDPDISVSPCSPPISGYNYFVRDP